MSPTLLQPVLYGALFMGVLSALPIISAGNCCCLWVTGGGMVTAYLMQRGQPAPITLGDGAFGGFLAGVLGSVIYLVVEIPIALLTAPMQEGMLDGIRDGLLDSGADVPPEMLDLFESVGSGGSILFTLIGFGFMLVLGMVFSTLGGLIGAAIFRKSTPHPGSGAPPAPPHLPA